MALVFALTIGWTALVAWSEVTSGKHAGAVETIIAVVRTSASAETLIIIYSLMVVTTLDALGGFAVITKRYLEEKWLKPQRDRLRREALEEGRKKGREEERKAWIARERRRVEAEAKRLSFDEPYPGMDDKSDDN